MSSVNDTSLDPLDGSARALRAAEERARERAQLLERQSSPHFTPEERISLWESLHMLSLPQGATHPLISLISAQTGLTPQQVRNEQQRRRAALTPADSQP